MDKNTDKPLGRKSYGSIPHLPNGRLGPMDYHIHEGQARILTEKTRDKRDRVIVTEKLDGACVAVANIDGQIVALGRSGHRAISSPHTHIQLFSKWVTQNTDRLKQAIPNGARLAGEWLAMAHGTIYADNGDEPFVPFDLLIENKRCTFNEFIDVASDCELRPAQILSDGPPVSVDDALKLLGERGHHGALEPAEGAVWRVERDGQFDFIAKFVRHEKVDGKYFESSPVWIRSAGLLDG